MSINVLEILTKEQAEILCCGYLRTITHDDLNPKDISSILTKYIGFGSKIITIHDENKPHTAKHLLFLKMYQKNDNLFRQVSIKILSSDCKFGHPHLKSSIMVNPIPTASPNRARAPMPNQPLNQITKQSLPFFAALDDVSSPFNHPPGVKLINKVDIRCGIIEIPKKNKNLNDNLYNILSFAITNKEQFNNKSNDNLKNICDKILDYEKQYQLQLRDDVKLNDEKKDDKKKPNDDDDHDDDIGIKYVSFGSEKSYMHAPDRWRQFCQVATHVRQLRGKFYSVYRNGRYSSIKIGNDDKINMVIKYDIEMKGYYLDVMKNNNLSIYDKIVMDMKNYHYYHVFEANNCCCRGKNINGLKYQIELIQNKDDKKNYDTNKQSNQAAPLPGQVVQSSAPLPIPPKLT